MVDAKTVDFTSILKDLLDQDAILVLNKSDLIFKDLEEKLKTFDHVLISIKEIRI